jgi:hypothetical protein
MKVTDTAEGNVAIGLDSDRRLIEFRGEREIQVEDV